MTGLRIEQPVGDAMLKDWQHAHNLILPDHPLSLDEVRARAPHDYLEVAYLGDVLVGCSTVRPPSDDTFTATVIARVLPTHRRRGFGTELCERSLKRAHTLGAQVVETVVLASDQDGLRFAHKHGFVETEPRLPPGETDHWITLRLQGDTA
ncbi:GNAT family N-acetyltransferase [Streptomyces fulvorobeus]|uniref:GNAT superfamily N-acetyltransferase n=1 Tax=Streptomyces fulvorobeus TaxID=284028 RepID=A0A7J0C8N9_9ACTN|nr:GNAT family N-acetyltransferase [Streptomyces fulvorobeus]NYE41940.1 GNAT superfamily N-acetyltransferase [Streptomyces fulvorobeus]GFM98313.1 hypothetical protein Sfulv_31240 [Streptomyces fulvorobeus]